MYATSEQIFHTWIIWDIDDCKHMAGRPRTSVTAKNFDTKGWKGSVGCFFHEHFGTKKRFVCAVQLEANRCFSLRIQTLP